MPRAQVVIEGDVVLQVYDVGAVSGP